MSFPCARAHSPRLAGGAVVGEPEIALAVIDLARRRCPAADVVAVLLGSDRRAHGIVSVTDTEGDPDALFATIEVLGAAGVEGGPCDLVVATFRPDGAPLVDDAERWTTASEIAEDAGAELVEWFVVTAESSWCPRELTGDLPRW